MLLMFVVGTGSVGWMLALGTVMAAEKNLPAGRRLADHWAQSCCYLRSGRDCGRLGLSAPHRGSQQEG